MALLEVSDLSVSYGAIRAVQSISLTVGEGEIVALVGPNGAGKSSTLAGIVGLVPATGAVRFGGMDILGLPTELVVRGGLTLCPEGRRVFRGLTVLENLRLGALAARDDGARTRGIARAFTLFPALAQRRDQTAGTLSGGEQQMLAMARALMSAPKLLLLDEPSLGLAPQIAERILDTVVQLRGMGHAILMVEQNVEAALDIADRAYVMLNGTIAQSGCAHDLARSDTLREMMFGGATS